MNDAFVFVGSNIDRDKNYPEAVRCVADLGTIIAASPVYDTVPVGSAPDAPHFYNGALWVHTRLKARDLRNALRQIETRLGRVRSRDLNAPRTIDLDLVLYNDDVIQERDLDVPDPLIFKRAFMARALADISPDYIIPPDGPTLAELAARLKPARGEMQPAYSMSEIIQQLVQETAKERPAMSEPANPGSTHFTHSDAEWATGPLFDQSHALPEMRVAEEKELTHREIAEAVRTILLNVGEDPTRQGLKKTPERVARAYDELLAGYNVDPVALVNGACFDADYHEMVVVKDIEFFSLCEHHMLPFFGKVHVAYIPDGKVLGLSKIPRIVEMYARRLQLQERMTQEIANFLNDLVHPRGVAVIVSGQHMCSMMRGVRKVNARMVTQAMLGDFESKDVREQLNEHLHQVE